MDAEINNDPSYPISANQWRRNHDERVLQIQCVQVIERAWLCYRNRCIFRLLKHSIRAVERSLPLDILRRICTREAELLNDPCMKVKVRFRFGGNSFPPLIFFKIFVCNSSGRGVKYVSGKRMIRPSSDAARNACELMGHRKFYDQLTVDALHHRAYKMTDEVDVTTLKDYMKYSSVLDETPACMGGKDNTWRQLTLEALPRQTVFYDVVDFLYNHKMSPQLQAELPTLLQLPLTQEIQLKHVQIITSARATDTPAVYTTRSKTKQPLNVACRRSKQARIHALKMKQVYQQTEAPQSSPNIHYTTARAEDEDYMNEEEIRHLYEWTQELSFDELVATPRLTNTRSTIR